MSSVLAFTLLLTQAGPNQVTSPSPGSRDDRDVRLRFMVRMMEEFTLAPQSDRNRPFKYSPQPVLRYSNPVRAISLSDGGVFVWLDDQRPVAVACISVRSEQRVYREFTSLTDRALVCSRDGQAVWSPASGGLLRKSLDDAPPPAKVDRLRLAQMRTLANRFGATYFKPDTLEPTQLRLMPQPIYRFEDKSSNIVDGAIFAFAESNDPELLLMIEAVGTAENKEKVEWYYSLARMSSVPLAVRLDEREVWSVPSFWRSPRSPDDPYVEAFVTKLPEADALAPKE